MGPSSNTKTPETPNLDAVLKKEEMLHHDKHSPSQLFWDL